MVFVHVKLNSAGGCLSQFECANLQRACPRMEPIWCRINVPWFVHSRAFRGVCLYVCVCARARVNIYIIMVKGKIVTSICSSCVYGLFSSAPSATTQAADPRDSAKRQYHRHPSDIQHETQPIYTELLHGCFTVPFIYYV